jgi:hypothetical protein
VLTFLEFFAFLTTVRFFWRAGRRAFGLPTGGLWRRQEPRRASLRCAGRRNRCSTPDGAGRDEPDFTLVAADTLPEADLHAATVAAFADYLAGPFEMTLAQFPSFIGRQGIDLARSRVAVRDGAIVAFAFVCPRPEVGRWRLGAMGALPAARGTGAAPACSTTSSSARGPKACPGSSSNASPRTSARCACIAAAASRWWPRSTAGSCPTTRPRARSRELDRDLRAVDRAQALAWLADADQRLAWLPFPNSAAAWRRRCGR